MNVSLTPELEKYVYERLKSGLYTSASEVIREGLRLLADQDRFREMRLAALNREIEVGLAEARAGKVVDGEKAFARILKRSGKRRSRKEA